jgi:hypothetical protein
LNVKPGCTSTINVSGALTIYRTKTQEDSLDKMGEERGLRKSRITNLKEGFKQDQTDSRKGISSPAQALK